ncbi:MAG: hypothetical protein WKF36_02075 [Candidatus Nitrosocosmicus sp.]
MNVPKLSLIFNNTFEQSKNMPKPGCLYNNHNIERFIKKIIKNKERLSKGMSIMATWCMWNHIILKSDE